MKVGIPILKCSLNPSQQVNKKTGKKSKTCSVKSAWNEMNDNRFGRDTTIDKELTYRNVWMHGNTTDNIEQIIQKEIDRINVERREAGKRALRSDAISMIEIIEKPNIELMEKLNYEEKKEFLFKSHDVMENLIKEWNPNWQWIASVQHHDEFGGISAHNHSLIIPSTFDEDGVPNLRAKKEVDIKFFTYINKNYPKLMREAGYTMVEDCVTYDQLTEEEKIERRLHPKEHGIDAYKFKQKKFKEMEHEYKELNIKNEVLKEKLEKNIIAYTNAPDLQTYNEISKENESMKYQIKEKDSLIIKLESELKSATEKMKSWEIKFIKLSKLVGKKIMNILGFKEDELKIQNEMPMPVLIKEVDSINQQIQNLQINDYRVVPDQNKQGIYKVIKKEKNNDYSLIKSDFKTRNDAEIYIKQLKDMKLKFKMDAHEIGLDKKN